jgi:hypothetical protein
VTSAWTRTYEYMDEEHSDECMDDRDTIEYMDEEHSDECMDDTLVYMSTANAIRANNMSATNMCAARNIVTSGVNTSTWTRNIVTSTWTIERQYEEHSDDTIIIRPRPKPSQAKPSQPFMQKIVRCSKKGPYIFLKRGA